MSGGHEGLNHFLKKIISFRAPIGYILYKRGICGSKYAAWRKECTKIDGLFMYMYNRYAYL